MKTIITTLFIALLAMTASAQTQNTLFDTDVRVTGFGGTGVYYTQFDNEPQVLVGMSGAVLLNSTVYLGGAVYGMASQTDAGLATMDGRLMDTHYEGGYCGVLLGTVLRSGDVVHASADVLVGGGGISRVEDNREGYSDDTDRSYETDGFFSVQPMAHLEINAFRWMRADLGAGYRFVSGIERFGLDNNAASGPVAGVSFRFGAF